MRPSAYCFILFVLSIIACRQPSPPHSLDEIQGQWLRIYSTDNRADSMQVLVEEDSAIITYVPTSSSFPLGAQKWAAITPTARDHIDGVGDFVLYDLSGNLSSYEATLFYEDDTLKLRNLTYPNAPGGHQRWVRN